MSEDRERAEKKIDEIISDAAIEIAQDLGAGHVHAGTDISDHIKIAEEGIKTVIAAVRAERDEEWAKAARELLEAEYRLGDMMSNKNHDLYRAALDNYTTKRNALAALVEVKR